MASNLINEVEAAKMLGISVFSLRTYRCTRRVVIPYTKIGKSVRYSVEVIQRYIDAQTIGGTE